jgi:predicted dehydrogenase
LKTVKFAFVGCGRIAHCHADVIKHLGHTIEVVVARPGSANINGFAEKYSVDKKIYGVEGFLEHLGKSDIDCILVCTPWDVTEGVLKQLLPLDMPIMSEKPAVLSSAGLKYLKEKYEMRNLFVAYNRRFYDFIPYLKNLMDSETCVCADVLSAEPCKMLVKSQGEKIREYMLYFYTSHIIDLIYYLFGDFDIKNVVSIARGRKNSWVCELYSAKRKCPIQLKILMDCPQNSYFKIFFEEKVAEMCPFEKMVVYNDLERRETQGRATYKIHLSRAF